MNKEYYEDNINLNDIIQIEERLYEHNQNMILSFEKRFSEYKCDVEVIDFWTTGGYKNATTTRPYLDDKYVYWICYRVLHNGKQVIYDDENSPLMRNYVVLDISKGRWCHKHKFIIKVFDDTEDVKKELEEDLNRLEAISGRLT